MLRGSQLVIVRHCSLSDRQWRVTEGGSRYGRRAGLDFYDENRPFAMIADLVSGPVTSGSGRGGRGAAGDALFHRARWASGRADQAVLATSGVRGRSEATVRRYAFSVKV